MTRRELSRRSFRYYFRTHLGALAGATAAAAVLIGALAVGDSVRESLKQKARERTGSISWAIRGGDRFFRQDLLFRSPAATLLQLSGTVARQDGAARVNRVTILGVRRDLLHALRRPGSGQSIAERSGSLEAVDIPPPGSIALSQSLAQSLNVVEGDELIVRILKPSALSRDAVVTPRDDQSVALRLRVASILPPGAGSFSLEANQEPPLTAWIDMDELGRAVGLTQLANLLLYSESTPMGEPNRFWAQLARWANYRLGSRVQRGLEEQITASYFRDLKAPARLANSLAERTNAQERLKAEWTLDDVELAVRQVSPDPALSGGTAIPPLVELITRRIFLEGAAVRAALTNSTRNSQLSLPPVPLLTYLVNSISVGDKLTPYSLITAGGAPYTPADLRDDEIVVNEWLARDLGIGPGDTVALRYYRVDAGTQLIEHTNTFRVHSVIPLKGLHADRTLMPEFPGLSKAESTRDWDAGFELVHPIREQDEAYWKQWRGTPKAFISLAAGQKLWANRFGELTAIRWFPPDGASLNPLREAVALRIRDHLDPAEVGLVWQPVRDSALQAATSGQDFGGLFLGFSFFLIISALLLTSMLFQFGLEQRATETGLLLAIGWPPGHVRRLLLREGLVLAIWGTVLGAGLGALYAKGVIWGLSTLWRDAVAGAGIQFHLTFPTLIMGILLSVAVAVGTLWLALRHQARRSARELLNQGGAESPEGPTSISRGVCWGAWTGTVLGLALTAMGWFLRETNPETFFGAGALLLVAALLWVRWGLAQLALPQLQRMPVRSLPALAFRGLTRRPSRSVGTIALLASAAFLIVAVAANRLDANRHATARNSGTGGFALWGESTLPILQDLNTRKGQEFYGLEPADLAGVSVVGFRVRDGDDASCLNLNRAQRPRLLGVNPLPLAERGAFTFTKLISGLDVTNGWLALTSPLPLPSSPVSEIPAIGDANSIQWALGKKVGDTLDYLDERGQPFKVRIVGAVANSVLQGSLIISDADFVRFFPSESGQRVLLIDAPGNAQSLSTSLSRSLQDVGLELTPTVRRLNRFNAVQNTYLNTFQILGGLGLLLGSLGLGVVVVRNVFDRRGELALMQALGFERPHLRRLLLTEHLALLLTGLGLGTLTAGLAVLPALLTPGSGIPWGSLALTLTLVLLNGLVWTAVAVARALRGRLLDGLRDL